MIPVKPAVSKLQPSVDNGSSFPSAPRASDPHQLHWPTNEAIQREVIENFALREAPDLARVRSALTETLEQLGLPSSTQNEENTVVEKEVSAIPQDSLTAFLAPEPKFFIGRKEQLETLHKILLEKKILVVIPEEDIFCRIGKSAITSQYVKSCSPVFWISARSRKALDTSFVKLAKLFGLEPSKIKDYLSVQGKLIVFDGAQDHELLKGYIPQGKCQVIITSRQREWPFPQIEIGPFSPEEAVDFLCQLTHKGDRVAAKRIAEELDCLPTSLEKAAHMIVEHQAELSGYEGISNGILDKHNQRLKQRSNLGDRNRNFTGREMGLVALEETFKTYSRAVITGKRRMAAGVGLGGVGKTQIALQYAFRNADKYPYLVWRVNCDNYATLQESYRELADKMEVYLSDKEKKQENALIKRVNQKLERQTGWLLIYDNAEGQEILKGLTPNQGGHVLITSRSPDWEGIGVPKVFKVGVFKRKESKALIQKVASLNETDANLLAELVQDLPIAVSQASAYIHETKIPYAEYARLFKEKSQLLLPAQDPTDEYSKTVNVTWQISMERIAEREKVQAESLSVPYPIAEPLMNFCAFLGSINIPKEELLLHWIKKIYSREVAALDDLNRTLQLLRNFSIIDINEIGISIHPIVQLVTRKRLAKEEVQNAFSQGISALIHQMMKFKQKEVGTWNHSKICFPHALALFDKRELLNSISLENQYKFLQGLGVFCLTTGDMNKAFMFNETCLEIAKKWNEEDSQSLKSREAVATSSSNIGIVLCELGEAQKGLSYHEDAFNIRLSLHGETDPDIATSYSNMGATFQILGEPEKALEYHKKALAIRCSVYPKNHPDIAASYSNIGEALRLDGKAQEALSNHKNALEIRISLYGEIHPDVAISHNNIGATFGDLKDLQNSLNSLKKAQEIWRELYGEKHPDVALGYLNIGEALRIDGQAKECLQFFHNALEIWRELYGENNLNVATCYLNMGEAYKTLGNVEEGLVYTQKVLERFVGFLGENHPYVAVTYINMGEAHGILNRAQECLEFTKKAYLILSKCFPEEKHPYFAEIYKNIEKAFKILGKLQEFKSLEEAIQIQCSLWKESVVS